MSQNAESVIKFWIEAGPQKWFTKNDDFDEEIKSHFLDLYSQAANGELNDWGNEPDGCLALILLLDQFSRNMFRGEAKDFAQDPKCRDIAKIAVERNYGEKVNPNLRFFLFMPFMHSENLVDQRLSLTLQKTLSAEGSVKSAQQHLEIIERFGRFPHRNEVLGRQSTPDEIAYLNSGAFNP